MIRPLIPLMVGVLLVVGLVAPSGLAAQAPAVPPTAVAGGTFYAVSYVEVAAASRIQASPVLTRYRDESQRSDGNERVDVFEQIGRPGHFAIIETWRDVKAFDARDAGVRQRLLDSLKPIRVSDYDQRPYKTLSVAALVPGGTSAGSVAAGGGTGGGARGAVNQAGREAVTVIAHVDVTPNPAVPPMLTRLAETSRTEAGSIRFDVLQHTMRGNHFTVVETWTSQQALDAHVAAAHTRQYRDEIQPLTGSPLDERVYRLFP
jgi:quinol monooxygenase YgiN